MEKKLDGSYSRMLRTLLNKSWWQHPTKQQLYGHLPPITKIIQIRRGRHAGPCRRSKDELICDILQWTSSHERAKVGRPARTYQQQLCADTRCSLEPCRERWIIGTNDERGSGKSVLAARHDDDDYSVLEISINSAILLFNCSNLVVRRSPFTFQHQLITIYITNNIIFIYVVPSIGFQTFLYRHLKLS